MDECDFEAEQTAVRCFVDQLRTLDLELPEGSQHVVDLVREMVHAGPAPGEEATHRRVVGKRRHELDSSGSHQQGGGLDPLVGHGVPMLDDPTQQGAVGLDRSVEVGDREADVVDAQGTHLADATGAVPGRSVDVGGSLEQPHRAHRLGGPGLGWDVREEGIQLLAVDRLLLE